MLYQCRDAEPVSPIIWEFSRNKTASKELITWLVERPQVEPAAAVVIPAFEGITTWIAVRWSMTRLFRFRSLGRRSISIELRSFLDNKLHISGYPAPPAMAAQIRQHGTMPTMLAMLQRGDSIDRAVTWAAEELEGFKR